MFYRLWKRKIVKKNIIHFTKATQTGTAYYYKDYYLLLYHKGWHFSMSHYPIFWTSLVCRQMVKNGLLQKYHIQDCRENFYVLYKSIINTPVITYSVYCNISIKLLFIVTYSFYLFTSCLEVYM